jgi:hypothetical protein
MQRLNGKCGLTSDIAAGEFSGRIVLTEPTTGDYRTGGTSALLHHCGFCEYSVMRLYELEYMPKNSGL